MDDNERNALIDEAIAAAEDALLWKAGWEEDRYVVRRALEELKRPTGSSPAESAS